MLCVLCVVRAPYVCDWCVLCVCVLYRCMLCVISLCYMCATCVICMGSVFVVCAMCVFGVLCVWYCVCCARIARCM